MRVTVEAGLLIGLTALAASPAFAQAARGSVYLSLMGEPFLAQTGQSPFAMWLARADIDRDGSVSLAELTIDADRFFKTLDSDADGRIGPDEMTRYEQQVAPAGLRAAAGARPVGIEVSRDWARAPGQFSGQRETRRGRDSLPGGMSRRPMSMDGVEPEADYTGASSIPQPVAMTDVDMSGSVTADEFARAAARRFGLRDVNKNGLLDAAELSGRVSGRR